MAKSHLDIKDLTMQKPYLSISEAAAKFEVSTDILRKWEREFPQYLHPRRTGGDTRMYSRKDIQQLAVIYRLLRVERLSIEGAKLRLKGKGVNGAEAAQDAIQRLQTIKQRLLGIIDELDKYNSSL